MAFPSFTTGEVLTAADMNAVGLWLVKTQTIGTAVSSVTVNDAFSASYDNYKIIVTGGASSTSTPLKLTLGSTATGYAYVIIYANSGTASGTAVCIGATNDTSWLYAGYGSANTLVMNIELQMPYAAKRTSMTAAYVESVAPGSAGNTNGFLANTTSYTGFTITPNTGTLTGGTIRVYGYRN